MINYSDSIQKIFNEIIENIKSYNSSYVVDSKLPDPNKFICEFISNNKAIIFNDFIYKLYSEQLNNTTEEIFNKDSSLTYGSGSNEYILNKKNYRPNWKVYDKNYDASKVIKNITIENSNITSKATYSRVMKKIKISDFFINTEMYINRNLFGIVSTIYNNTVYNAEFALTSNNLKLLYKILCEKYFYNDKIKNAKNEMLNDPFNLYILEKIIKTENLYFLSKLKDNKNIIYKEQYYYLIKLINSMTGLDLLLTSFKVIESFFSAIKTNTRLDYISFHILINNTLPKMYNDFKKNLDNINIQNISDTFVKSSISLFNNIFGYTLNKQLTSTLIKNCPDISNKDDIKQLLNELLDLTEVPKNKRKQKTNKPIKEIVDILNNLTNNTDNLFNNKDYENTLNSITQLLDKKIKIINYIVYNHLSYHIFEYVENLKETISYIPVDKSAVTNENGYKEIRYVSDKSYHELSKIYNVLNRDKKYKNIPSNLKDVITYYEKLLNIKSNLEILIKILDIKATYRLYLLYNYMNSSDVLETFKINYNNFTDIYRDLSQKSYYEGIYMPALTYLYLNPDIKKNLSETKTIYDVYGKYVTFSYNKKYFQKNI